MSVSAAGIRAAVVLSIVILLGLASSALASFGFVPGSVNFAATNADGSPVMQAGAHPYALTTAFRLKETMDAHGNEIPDGDLKNIFVELPPGLVGDATATVVPQCTQQQFTTPDLRVLGNGESCPDSTAVGVAEVRTTPTGGLTVPVLNLAPPPGVPAEFGFNLDNVPVIFAPTVRSGGDYGLTVSSRNTSQGLHIFGATVTFWGVPADPTHDGERGDCRYLGGSCPSNAAPQAFLTMPPTCNGPFTTTFTADSWQHPGSLHSDGSPALNDPRWVSERVTNHDAEGNPLSLNGCGRLAFNPQVTVQPDTSQADTPAGLTAEVKQRQDGLLTPENPAPADILNTTVVLPAGLVVNPGQAVGLKACQASEDGVGSELAPSCPPAARIGTDEIETPLLKDTLKGDVYILQSNPPHLQILVAASADGVEVKLVGNVGLDGSTGQLTTTFAGTPPVPFTDFRLRFSGGAQAALATPATCGSYETTSDFTPWSAPLELDSFSTDHFAIRSAPAGGVCLSSLPFSPAMIAGATTDQAGGYTNFSLLLQRADGQQRVESLQFKTPAGLSGMISHVPLCAEPAASLGTCPEASKIGHAVVAAGPGPFPLIVPEPGKAQAPIYLTGPYKGAPYGLSVAVPVEAGPFNLGTVIVRSSIAVDQHTAQLTVTTDPLPRILDGIPTDLRTINAVIDRAEFLFNPTNCSQMAFAGTAFSTEGATASLSSHFQVGSCRSLTFKPGFKVSTSGRTSRKNGASLDAIVSYPSVPAEANQASGQANIASVKVDLPKQLPSRLTTLQKACPAATFDANPATCPSASMIGHATALTPVLPVALAGPAYFVSHGGEAFPSLIIVLQGYGVKVDLVATTFISKAGITSSTFKQVPDVPFSKFELKLPQGPYSALAANGSLCQSNLRMPTAFTAQNGAKIHDSTKIAVIGCSKHKNAKVHKARKRHRG